MTISRLLLSCMLLCCMASAQLLHPVSAMPGFTVVSIHPTDPKEELSHGGVTSDSYRAERTTTKEVLAYAFGLAYDHELINAPSWIGKNYFDIHGRLDDDQVVSLRKLGRDDRDEQMRLMVQSMLVERFHLIYHFEKRQLPAYVLEIAKSGLRCRRDTTSQPAIADPSQPRFRWSAAPAPPPPPPDWHPPLPSEQKILLQSLHLRTKGWPFWLIVASLSHQPELEGRPVIDRTSLNGAYDCEMNWSQAGSDGTGQFFFSAVQDQLGLKFRLTKAQVEVLVIDSISPPSEN